MWVVKRGEWVPRPGSVLEERWMGAKPAASGQSASLEPFPWVRGVGGLQTGLTLKLSSSSPPHINLGHH